MTLRISLGCVAVAAVLLTAREGQAQQQLGPVSGGVVTSTAKPLSPENGVRLGDGALLHAGVGVEAGYDSNVFYNDSDRAASAVLRVTPFMELTNTSRNGEVPSGLFYDLRALVLYREYFSDQPDVTRLRSFSPTVNAAVEHNSRGSLAVGATEIYTRAEDAPYTRGTTEQLIIRNNNTATAQLRWAPGGGRLQGLVRYTNTIDWFETDYLKPANAMGHEGMLDLSWRWLPKTALYLQLRQGYISYFNSDPGMTLSATQKSSSYPLRAVVGIRGLVTEKTSVALALGYQNGFYSNGVNTGGFLGSTSAAAEVVYLPILSTRLSLGVRHDFQNSVIGNFYYSDGTYATASQQISDRFVGQLWGSYDYRRYYGLPGAQDPRRDKFTQAGVILDYYLKTWAYAGVSYTLNVNRSDYMPMGNALAGVNYTKHQTFARVGITY